MAASSPPMYSIRRHRPGDMGLIIHQHAILYEQSVGWGPSFEADVARTTLDFLDNFDSDLERVFIVESAETSKFLGSAAVFKHRKEVSTAQLRLLLVDPTVRGAGLGAKLIDECVRFARECGYAKILLWTYDALGGARRLYHRAGFRVIASTEENEYWGVKMSLETWELALSGADGQST